jgi:general secretion pathway protein A
MPRRQQNPQPTTDMPAPNADPFPYSDYLEAKKTLQSALRGPRFYGLVTGPSGTGKTCLLRDISADIDRGHHHIIYVSSSRASLVSIVRVLALTFHVNPHRSHLETIHTLGEAIQSHATHLLLWIDEADQLAPEVLQQLRMLAEASPAAELLMSIVLAGLSGLLDTLNAPSMFPLKRRISLRCMLAGLRRDELDLFIEHRFGTRDAQRIAPEVRNELFERTQATPALIDQVVRRALAQSNDRIDTEVLHAIYDTQAL